VLSAEDDRLVLAQVRPDEAVILRAWRGAPTAAPSLPAWATAEGVVRGETTRQSGGPAGSGDGAGLHVHVERLRWPAEAPPPWATLLDPPAPRTVRVTVSDAPAGTLKLVGGAPELGGWDPQAAPTLTRTEGGGATLELSLPAGEVAALKLVLLDPAGEPTWEPRSDRYLQVGRAEDLTAVEYAWGR
jgi:hypothetical protein